MKLLGLPSEILIAIVSHLQTSDNLDVTTILNLCLTSRHLAVIAQSALYTNVKIHEATPDPLKNLKHFLINILKNPALGRATRELCLINDRGVRYEWPAVASDVQFMRICEMIGGLENEIEPDICCRPLAVEVLSRLPNLEKLYLTAEIEQPRALVEWMHERQRTDGMFERLKAFHLHKTYEDGPINLFLYIPFLRYPAFQTFSSQTAIMYPSPRISTSNTITHSTIRLNWCMGPPSTFSKLLNTCPTLTSFELFLPDRYRPASMSDVAYWPQIAPKDLVNLLLEIGTHAQTLETLRLDFQFMYHLGERELQEEILENGGNLEDNDYTYPCLHGFENLKVLAVEFEKLVKVAFLPASLEKLELMHTRFHELCEQRLKSLLRLKRSWCPLIREVDIHGRDAGYDGMREVLGHARRLNATVEADLDEYPSILKFLGEAEFLVVRCCEMEEGCGNWALEIGIGSPFEVGDDQLYS